MRFAVALCVSLSMLLGAIQAEEVHVAFDDTKPGTYLVTVGADKSVTANPIRVVRPGNNPAPPPTNPTNPPGPSPFTAEVERLTKETLNKGGTNTTGAALSSVYSLVADEVAAGRIAPASALPAIKAASDLVLTRQADGAAWATWRASVGDALTILNQQGLLGTKEQMSDALKQISAGLNRATGFSHTPNQMLGWGPGKLAIEKADGILGGIDLQQLMELIKLIVELLKLFGIGK